MIKTSVMLLPSLTPKGNVKTLFYPRACHFEKSASLDADHILVAS